jgi:spore maturation protein SpmA
MNVVFLVMVLSAFAAAAWRQAWWVPAAGQASPMEALSKAMVDSAAGAVELSLSLVGVMTLFLGLMKVAEAGGLLRVVARLIRPLMVRLFPDIPPGHPAMGAMILNLSANVLGLGNAATPFGIRAMQELEKLNPRPGTATDAMVLFLAINTSSVTLLPTGVIALRAAAGSADPAAILPATLLATAVSTAAAVAAAKLLRRAFPLPAAVPAMEPRPGPPPAEPSGPEGADEQAYPVWASLAALAAVLALIPAAVLYGRALSPWILPGLMVAFLLFGALRRVRVYEEFVSGAKEGFQVAVRIIPYLVAVLAAIGMLRASGALDAMVAAIGPFTGRLGLPAEVLPMALMRPLSGSGAYALLAAIVKDPAIGPDSYAGMLASTIQGCTETTFYVLAVYFGAVQVRRIRHALAAGLTADLVGILASVAACILMFAD